MKTMVTMTVAAAMLASTALSPALARDTAVVLSPRQDPGELRAQVETVVAHLAAALKPGETALIFDGADARLVAEIRVPAGAAYDNPRAKLQANAAALGALKRWFDAAQAVPGRVAQVDLPKVLKLIRRNYPAGGGADLIVVASQIWAEADAPSLSMHGGRVPGDGLVSAPAAESPFGTAGVAGSLAGYDVRFGLIGEDETVSAAHRYALERFWSLQVEAQGGSMAYYGDDLKTLFRNAGTDAPDRPHADPLVPTEKREMMVFLPDAGAPAEPQPAPAPAEAAIWRAAQGVTLGIRWSERDADLDLYVRPAPGAKVIFFGEAETEDGRLFKDLRSAPRGGFETVALTGVTDLGEVAVWVNHYAGRAPQGGLTFELHIAIGDQVWTKSYALPGGSGNKGAGAERAIREGVAPNEAWAVIRPLEVVAED